MRLGTVGRACRSKRSPGCRGLSGVDGAGRWRESQCSYPGRPVADAGKAGNLHWKVQLRRQESAEAIVLLREEGPNMRPRERSYEFERGTEKAENPGKGLP